MTSWVEHEKSFNTSEISWIYQLLQNPHGDSSSN